MFLDADDCLDENALRIMFDTAEQNSFPMVCCKYKRFVNEGEIIKSNVKDVTYTKLNVIYEDLQARIYAGTIWGILIKRQIITRKKLSFIEALDYGEDTLFKLQLLHEVDCIIEIDSILYWWRITPGSLSFCATDEKFISREKALIEKAIDVLVSADRESCWDSMMVKFIRVKKNSLFDFCDCKNIEPKTIKKKLPLKIVVHIKGNFGFKLIECIYVMFPFLETWKIQRILFRIRREALLVLKDRQWRKYDS